MPLFSVFSHQWYCCEMNEKNIFPKDFLWGTALSSYQVEGGLENTDWAQGARDGKVPPCGTACDHYNRYEQDFDIAQSLGHNAHRLSIEWSRIEPEEGKFDEKEIEHYRDVLRALHARGIYPLVTLWHFWLPLWFSRSGGWERKDSPEVFARYCTYVVEQLGDLCDNYATINEPMIFTGWGYVRGFWPPFFKKSFLKYFRVLSNLVRGHNSTYTHIKKLFPQKQIGIVKHTIAYGTNGNPLNTVRAWFYNFGWTHLFMRKVYKNTDWIGLNYYNRRIFGDTRELAKTDMGWNNDPEGIYDALCLLWKYKKPIFVAEAGCADAEDRFRADYIRGTVRGIEQALESGIDVRGFCYWSLLDNYELAEGFSKKFGLVEVNLDTQERTVRPSAFVYRDLIKHHQR